MKNLIIPLLFVSLFANGQKIKTSSSIELGWTDPYYKIAYSDGNNFNTYKAPENSMYADIMLKFTAFKYFTIQNNLETYFISNGGIKFSPFMSIYTIQVYGTYKFIEIGYKHQCIHPVISVNEKLPTLTQFSGNYDKLYIKIILF